MNIKLIGALIILCLVMPIWFYLLYSILTAIDAGELQWFLFYIYVPFSLFASIMIRLAEGKQDEQN